jgi:hypothetical protein
VDLRVVRPYRVLHAEEVGTSLRREQGDRKSWRWQLGVTLLVFGAYPWLLRLRVYHSQPPAKAVTPTTDTATATPTKS